MTPNVLTPSLDLLTQEYVLVQAWKKTANYIRYHNWYSDTLELDRTAVDLPRFLGDLAAELSAPDEWRNDSIRIVPAPKSQHWQLNSSDGGWEPVKGSKTGSKLRPLAHVSLKDQVAATGVMLCLADRVETAQGDPRAAISSADKRRGVISYGNRLFCDLSGSTLRHRWGSGKLYRAYYQDYRAFLDRPEIVAQAVSTSGVERVVVVHSDLRQFYDRVRPALLLEKIQALRAADDDSGFYALTARLLNWQWHKGDAREVTGYAQQADLAGFSNVALPQGLVAAGFLANVVLLDFDQALRSAFYQEIAPGVRVQDVCRYVDDFRVVVTVDGSRGLLDIEQDVAGWIQTLLDRHANGLHTSLEKTRAAALRGDDRPLVAQSRKMARIQSAVSGGFDAIGGEEILDAVQGLIRSQHRYSERRVDEHGWELSPVPDVRDATVARFAAARFRTTYRSLRPLLADRNSTPETGQGDPTDDLAGRSRVARSQAELDHDARAFALGLIENWVEDPSNVRLLRIGLDLWPDPDVVKRILSRLRPFTEKGGKRKAPRRVAWYCLAEIFRAGATETGFVEEAESLPAGLRIDAYRDVLVEEAIRLMSLPGATLPWYLKQQVLLFLASHGPMRAPVARTGRSTEMRHYRELIRYLRGDRFYTNSRDFVTLAILSRRSFGSKDSAAQLAVRDLTPGRLEEIGRRDPAFALEILESHPEHLPSVPPRLRDDLCLESDSQGGEMASLACAVLRGGPTGNLRNELSLLRFARRFLESWPGSVAGEAITPSDVLLKVTDGNAGGAEVESVRIVPSRIAPGDSMYRVPSWCAPHERWRIQLGYLLRFILTARVDFTKVIRGPHWREQTAAYRAVGSHWRQRLYGLFNGQSAFGDDWLPISDWTEQLLSALLHWPGCTASDLFETVQDGIDPTRQCIEERLRRLLEMQPASGGVMLMPVIAPWPVTPGRRRPLRACVVQTVVPTPDQFDVNDLACSGPAIRKSHRNHLSAALAAVERMLDLRETHKGREGRLDWLILPELSVHPRDVKTHLVPFARTHKTIILAGLTYQELFAGRPLVNSALWVVPVVSEGHGLQVVTRRQGKYHLAPEEGRLNATGTVVQGFRPCQWLMGYQWSTRPTDRPLWLTASVCYDATDLSLATALRDHSDVLAIPALNKDVGTFDQMAAALHYHMFQLVIVANNGLYGGSSAHAPYEEPYVRQVFHLHGQPQATVAFLEIEDVGAYLQRKVDARKQAQAEREKTSTRWKSPPAGIG